MAVSTILALLLTQAAPQPATPAPAPADPARAAASAKIQAAAQAFSACLGPKVVAVPATVTPEQGADSVLAACKTEQTAIETSVGTAVANLPADRQAAARKQLTDSMAIARTQIADGIRQMRAATPPAAAKPAK